MTTDRAGPQGTIEREEIIAKAMEAHFRSMVEENAGMPFAETKVHMPTASFRRYAKAIANALATCGQPPETP